MANDVALHLNPLPCTLPRVRPTASRCQVLLVGAAVLLQSPIQTAHASLATLHCRSLPRKLLQSYQRLLSLLPPFLVSQMRMILVPQLSDFSGKKPALPSAHVCPQTPGYTGRLSQECFHCGPAETPGPKFHSAVNSFGENHVFLAGIANFY